MKTYPFLRNHMDSLVMVETTIDLEENYFGVDTGASQTLIDLNLLLMIGYSTDDFTGTGRFATADEIIEVPVLFVRRLTALGITRRNFEVCTFDFLQKGLGAEFSGLIGLDFFADAKVCIDFRLSEITIS